MLLRLRLPLSLALFATFVLVSPAALFGHAVLIASTPPAGAAIHGPSLAVSLRFNVRVDGSRSRCTVVSQDGKSVPFAIESQQRADVLSGSLTGLTHGKYTLRYQVLAADGHISRGELTFTVL
jgi:hypothetical protein